MTLHFFYIKHGLHTSIKTMKSDNIFSGTQDFDWAKFNGSLVAGRSNYEGEVIITSSNAQDATEYNFQPFKSAPVITRGVGTPITPKMARGYEITLGNLEVRHELVRAGAALHELPVCIVRHNDRTWLTMTESAKDYHAILAAAFLRLGQLPPLTLVRHFEKRSTMNSQLYRWAVEGCRETLNAMRFRLEVAELNLDMETGKRI